MTRDYLDELRDARRLVVSTEQLLGRLRDSVDTLMAEAVAAGVPSHEIATAADVSRARVSQVAPRPPRAEAVTFTPPTPETGPERSDVASGVIESLAGADTLSGRESRWAAKQYGWRETIWVDLEARVMLAKIGEPVPLPGDTLADVLFAAKWHQATRVFLIGPQPVADGEYGDAGSRAWFLADPGADWTVAPTGHHLTDAKSPTARYQLVDGSTVEIMRTAAWWGETDAGVIDSRAAWFALQEQIQAAFGETARLLATPATTGRDLWQRTIGPKTSYAVLSDELRELIHSTAGQGRIELLSGDDDRAHNGTLGTIPGVHVRDGRLMYSALTWGMPVGPPTLLTRDQVQRMSAAELDKAVSGRSRWHVRATVPRDWPRPFGLLMAPRDSGQGWRYPNAAGETFTTWCDGAELALAIKQGWNVEIHGGITWREGKPLNAWTERLLACWAHFETHPDRTMARLAQRAIRSLVLFSIGAFASRGRTVTYTLPEDRSAEVPAGVSVSRAGDMLVWTRDVSPLSWAKDLAHPEWSACIWARARVRLLDGPGVAGGVRTGALNLRDGIDVIAFRTDALVLTGDPGWGDDGRAGRLRYDGEIAGPFSWPETETEMLRLKTKAQKNAVHN